MPEAKTRHQVVISTGDPAGCSPELIPHLVNHVPDSLELIIVGPAAVRDTISFEPGNTRHRWIETGTIDRETVMSGQLSDQSGECAYQSLAKAVELCDDGTADGILTLPLSKEAVHRAGHESFKGHTAYFEDVWDRRAVMTFLGETLNVALLSRHIPLKTVPETLNEEFMVDQIKTATLFFENHQPDMNEFALLGLNPHAGEEGLIGTEETAVLEPVLKRVRSEGISMDGPFAPDSFFPVHADNYDCVFACYHDQGLIPFKMNHFYTGVHATLGLPIVRVSPDHGVAADLAGRNEIDPQSTINGIKRLATWLTDDQPNG